MHFFSRRLVASLVALSPLTFAGWASAQAPVPEAIASVTSSAPDGAQAIGAPALAEALRQGGYVIYFRHTATDFSRSDTGMKGYGDCERQRLLSAKGRSDARALGQHTEHCFYPQARCWRAPTVARWTPRV